MAGLLSHAKVKFLKIKLNLLFTSVLILRTYLITSRDKTLFYMRLLIHLFIGLGFGFIYKDVGNNGGAMFDNYRFLVVSVVFLLYTSYHSHIITCK